MRGWCFVALCCAACGGAASEGGAERIAGVIRGAIDYQGTREGELEVAAFSSFPPRGAPLVTTRVVADRYPIEYALEPLPSGRYFVLAIVDVDQGDGEQFHPTVDPGGAFGGFLSPITVTVGEEGAPDVDLRLIDPSDESPWATRKYR